MIYYAKLENNKLQGFYIESLHGEELCKSLNHVKVDDELHDYLLDKGAMTFIGEKEERIYGLKDQALFVKEILEAPLLPPTLDERIAALEAIMMEVL